MNQFSLIAFCAALPGSTAIAAIENRNAGRNRSLLLTQAVNRAMDARHANDSLFASARGDGG